MNELLLLFIFEFAAIWNHVLSVAWNVVCKNFTKSCRFFFIRLIILKDFIRLISGCFAWVVVSSWLRPGDQTLKIITLLEKSFCNPDTKILVFMKKKKKGTVIRSCNSWLDSASKAGEWWKGVSVSPAFDFVFVYMYSRPHLSAGGYCTQSRRVPVPGSRLLITPLSLMWLLLERLA